MDFRNCAPFRTIFRRYFEHGSTIHGMRYVCMTDSFLIRRLIWLIAFSACFVGFCVNAGQRLAFFLADPINVNIEISYRETMVFPAVTICNHNMFRITKAAEFGVYEAIKEILDQKATISNTSMLKNTSLSYYDVLAHAKRDMIFNCQFGGRRCSELDFDEARTDFGICYTFRPHDDMMIQYSGSSYGLIVTINVEQYEYMDGPETTAGVKVLLHDRHEVPRVGDLGFNVPAGFQALVGVQYRKVDSPSCSDLISQQPPPSRIQIENIPSPKSNCHKDGEQKLDLFASYDYTDIGCRAECEAKFLMEKCSCQPIDVPRTSSSLRRCSPFDERRCLQPSRESFRSVVANQNCTKCAPTCKTTSYIPSISYASISQTNAEKLLVREQKKVDVIRQRLLSAKENQSQLDAQFLSRDRRLIDSFFRERQSMVNQEFYPDEQILGKLSARLEPPCLAGIVSAIRQSYYITLDALKSMKGVALELSDYDTGIVLTSYIQFLWDVSLQLDHIRRVEIADVMNDIIVSHDLQALSIRYLRYRLVDVRRVVSDLKNDLNISLQALRAKLLQHRYLFADADQALFFKGLKNFTQSQVQCLTELDLSMHQSFADILKGLEQLSIDNFNLTRARIESDLDNVGANRLRCQEGFVNNADFDRASVEHHVTDMIGKAENDLHRSFDRFERILVEINFTQGLQGIELGFKALSTIESELQNYLNKSITKYDLSLNLTSDNFSTQLAFLTAFLAAEREFIQLKEDTLNEYLNIVRLLDRQTPQMLLEIFFLASTTGTNTTARILSAVSQSYVAKCKASIHETCQKRIRAQSELEQEMTRTIRELLEQLRYFNQKTKLDNSFVMENFLQLSIFYRELREELITQQRAYSVWGLLCDVGGGLGLFIGASFISCFELLDTFLLGFARLFETRNPEEREEKEQTLQYFSAGYLENFVKDPKMKLAESSTYSSTNSFS